MSTNTKQTNETSGVDNQKDSFASKEEESHSCDENTEVVWSRTQIYQGDLVTVTRYRCKVCGAEWTEAPWN
jgi:DNA-directed RNA polymerase subunit M/transcription elongation factor TFIIS